MLHISKLDAARRQLEVAVRMFFFDQDPVSIRTLAAAARGVLRDLDLAQGGSGDTIDAVIGLIRPERQKEIRDRILGAQNFFKHADKDPSEMLEFDIDENALYLFNVCELYRTVTSERVALFRLCTLHFELSYPELTTDLEAKALNETILKNIDPSNKFAFYSMLPDLERMLSEQGRA